MAEHKVLNWNYELKSSFAMAQKIEAALKENDKKGFKVLSHQMSTTSNPDQSAITTIVQIIFIRE